MLVNCLNFIVIQIRRGTDWGISLEQSQTNVSLLQNSVSVSSSGATRTCHILDSCDEIGHRTYGGGMVFEWIERHK